MTETKQLLERAERAFDPPSDVMEAVVARRDRRRRNKRVQAAVLGLALSIAIGWLGVSAIRSAPVPADTPALSVMRENGEVLSFTGVIEYYDVPGSPGDLVAADPRTGEERVLVEDLDAVYSAGWSADGRWFAYETDSTDGVGRDLWVARGSQAPRVVATGGIPAARPTIPQLEWKWSPTGAELATMEHSETLRTIDVATGETTDLGRAVADLGGPWERAPAWAWSPDRTHLVFASPARDGSLYSVDVRGGERSLLARLPDVAPQFYISKILWSPDGAHIAVRLNEGDTRGRLYVTDADGSDIRMVADDNNSLGFAWSPDGTRLAFGSAAETKVRIRVATADGGAPAEIGTIGLNPCLWTSYGGNYECSLTWSPDGTQVAIRKPPDRFRPGGRVGENGQATVFLATGAGESEPLNELTFLSWDGGWYRSD